MGKEVTPAGVGDAPGDVHAPSADATTSAEIPESWGKAVSKISQIMRETPEFAHVPLKDKEPDQPEPHADAELDEEPDAEPAKKPAVRRAKIETKPREVAPVEDREPAAEPEPDAEPELSPVEQELAALKAEIASLKSAPRGPDPAVSELQKKLAEQEERQQKAEDEKLAASLAQLSAARDRAVEEGDVALALKIGDAQHKLELEQQRRAFDKEKAKASAPAAPQVDQQKMQRGLAWMAKNSVAQGSPEFQALAAAEQVVAMREMQAAQKEGRAPKTFADEEFWDAALALVRGTATPAKPAAAAPARATRQRSAVLPPGGSRKDGGAEPGEKATADEDVMMRKLLGRSYDPKRAARILASNRERLAAEKGQR